jgi:hypothetical protein
MDSKDSEEEGHIPKIFKELAPQIDFIGPRTILYSTLIITLYESGPCGYPWALTG